MVKEIVTVEKFMDKYDFCENGKPENGEKSHDKSACFYSYHRLSYWNVALSLSKLL